MAIDTAVSDSRRAALDDPQILPFLPMVYVGWADGDLTSEEISELCTRIAKATGESCHRLLGAWLDPEQPPTPGELHGLLRHIRAAAPSLRLGERVSLADIGLAMAQADGRVSAVELAALAEIEAALGGGGRELARALAPVEPAAEEVVEPASFEPATLTALLDGETAAIKVEVRQFLAQESYAYLPEPGREDYREVVLAWCRELARRGYGALPFPEAQGGRGRYDLFIAVFETLAFHDLSLLVKFGVQFGLWGGSVLQLGTERHHQEYLGRIGTLELPGCFAMTETGHGSNVRDLETVARFDPESDEFVLHTPSPAARKDYIGNAGLHGEAATVFAQLEVGDERHGVHALVVPIRDGYGEPLPGVTIEDCGPKLGLNGVDNGRLSFDRVRVPRANLLDRFAQVDPEGVYTSPIPSASRRFFTMLGTLVGGRVSVAWAAVSVGKSALTIAIRYGNRRRQFGADGGPETRLLDYLTHQRRLLPALAEVLALDFALKYLTRRFVGRSGTDQKEVESLAAALKATSTWHATETVQVCRECCGGQGYLAENRFAALKADSDVFTTFEGDNTVLLQLVAKSLLSGYKKQFQDLSFASVLRYLTREAATLASELNPVVTRLTKSEHLRDADFQQSAFAWRERHLVSTVARRLKRRIDDGMESQRALIECQDHLVAAARAHAERIVHEQFTLALEAVEPAELATVLTRCRDLYALSRIEADRGWFLEHGYIEPPKSKAIRDEVNRLCAELRPDAEALVDGFAIPGACLAAPIGTAS